MRPAFIALIESKQFRRDRWDNDRELIGRKLFGRHDRHDEWDEDNEYEPVYGGPGSIYDKEQGSLLGLGSVLDPYLFPYRKRIDPKKEKG